MPNASRLGRESRHSRWLPHKLDNLFLGNAYKIPDNFGEVGESEHARFMRSRRLFHTNQTRFLYEDIIMGNQFFFFIQVGRRRIELL
ncbi:hypothetical protein [Scytonema sp. PRP1]|uniref:hypothetical protein n=1 Tax=Scytonema sp. PRP1 TaxID=3120513 RepID=UPI00300DAE44